MEIQILKKEIADLKEKNNTFEAYQSDFMNLNSKIMEMAN